MITPLLEKLILNGSAKVIYYSHYAGNFSSIGVDYGKVAIVTSITWNNFLNPHKELVLEELTYRDLINNNQYQLVVDGTKNKAIFTFNPQVNLIGVTNYDSVVNTNVAVALQPLQPQKLDTFIICSEAINVSINRNAYTAGAVYDMNQMKPTANQNNIPNGLQNLFILNKATFTSVNGSSMVYVPVSEDNCTIPATGNRRKENFIVDFESPDGAGAWGSVIMPVVGYPAFNSVNSLPLVTFEIVFINEELATKLANT